MKNLKSVFMLIVLTCLAFSFASCSSDDDNEKTEDNNLVMDTPGNISGLGSTEGEPTGELFKLPEGILLDGTITGSYGYTKSTTFTKNTKGSLKSNTEPALKASVDVDTVLGAGYYVHIYIPIKNVTTKNIDVVFPAGTIIISNSGKYQNGVLLKKASVKVPANESYKIALLMFCGNSSKSPSSISETYRLSVVSNSSLIVDLCKKLANKKINYEDFKKDEEGFRNQVEKLQHILWNLTDNGNALDQEDLDFIDAIPNL